MNKEQTKELKIKTRCFEQNEKFKEWAVQQKWATFHHEHYDWWAFPINQNSGCYGNQYKVQTQDYLKFKNGDKFITALRQNSQLVCKAWGWDLLDRDYITKCSEDQKWSHWPIRLYKMCKSLDLFDQLDLLSSALKYANLLLDEYHQFTYGRKNMTGYFRNREKQIADKINVYQHEQNKKIKQQQSIQNKINVNHKAQSPNTKNQKISSSDKN